MNRELKIRNLTIKNRIAVPPMVCFHWTDDDGYVTDKNIEHYRELAEGGAGLIIVEATAVSKAGRLAKTELGLWEDGQIEGFRKIVDVIHQNGTKAFIQINHAGGCLTESENEPEAETVNMPIEQIDCVAELYAKASLRAKEAGFDGVELHGCHGYLVSKFFNERENHREDDYGKDKTLFAKKVLKAIREACGEDYVVGIRLGAFEPLLEHGIAHAKEIASYVDFIDVSYGGNCNGKRPDGYELSEAVYGAECIKKELPDMPVFGVHNINSRHDVVAALKTGIDMADVGKASLVDPSFANHVLSGEEEGHCLHCSGYCRWNPEEMADSSKKCPGRIKYQKEA